MASPEMVSASCMWSRSHRVGSSMMRVAALFLDTPDLRGDAEERRVDRPVADLGRRSGGEPEQLLVAGGEDGRGVAGRRPDRVVPGEFDGDQCADRLGVAEWGDPTDRLTGVPVDEFGGCGGQTGDAEQSAQ